MNLPCQSELVKQARAVWAKKELGQHFLIAPEKLSLISSALNLNPEDVVVEIGPGLGFLTRFLVHTGAKVCGVEIDPDRVANLTKLSLPKLEIVHGDFLKCDLTQIATQAKASSLKIAGNIPYQITAPVVKHLFGEINKPASWLSLIKVAALTIQYEVALRMVAVPSTHHYSQLTLLVNYFCESELLDVLPSNCFEPPPAVKSAVVRLIPRATPAVTCNSADQLKAVIQLGFQGRRRMLRNNLMQRFSPEVVKSVFDKLNFDPQARAENLSLKQFAMLADALFSS